MKKAGRNYLTGSIMLSRNEDGSLPEEYFIKSVIGEGSSAVCYEAMRRMKNGIVETGKLKEFYPMDAVSDNQSWYYSLKRLQNGQLVPVSGTVYKFDEMCREYIGTYKLLRKVMADNPKNEILKSYIQHGEILYGCVEESKRQDDAGECRATVYIWSPGVPGKGFDVYLAEVKKNPAYKPEKKLQDIFCVIAALTDCIKALHTAGLMHMDIKPSNFLVQYDSDFEIRPSSISLFDINTLCSVGSEFLRISGTEGYRAPEVIKGRADNRSDIYSIGAMLFNALVIKKDIQDGLYRDFYYSDIDQMIKNSELFKASEINSDAALMSRICRILEKCLAKNPRKRYQSCSELKEDLEKARKRLNKMLWTPIEKSKEGVSEPIIVIQKLLYEHPLYENVSDDSTDISVLVIGSGTYGQKFIDVCLQAGQMANINLNITAVSDEPEEDKEAYLRFRPALCEFVNVDGSLSRKIDTAYADLKFRNVSETLGVEEDNHGFTSKPSQINREIVKKLIMKATLENKEYKYVFIALGNDKLSRSVAQACSEEMRHSCPVCYISQNITKVRKDDVENKLYPVCINEPVDMTAIDQNLGEMAFNAHISWNNTMNIDITRERQKFFKGETEKDRYHRTSSLAYVLSVKYKLHSIHIECNDLQEAAELFTEQVLKSRADSDDTRKKFDQLVALEHRRWVIEKAVDGWNAPRDEKGKLKLEDCILRGSVKDSVNHTHPCMVHSSETSPLSNSEYIVCNHAKWNEGMIDPKLDELDRMSIELHRCLKKHADKIRNDSLFRNPDIVFIQNLIPNECRNVVKAFKLFLLALKNIINGVESYSRQYGYYQEALKTSLNELPENIRAKIGERLSIIERTFFPVIESNLYRNYKASDEVLIEKIPFILTYRYKPVIAMAFEDGKYQNGRNEAVFTNVAAATVLSPEKICFLYCFNEDSSIDLLVRKLEAILNYFRKRKMHCGVELIVSCLKEIENKERERLYKELNRLKKQYQQMNGNAWFEKEKIFNTNSYREAAICFSRYLKECPVDLYDGGNQLFPSGNDNAIFIELVTGQNIPYFEFDWRNKFFIKHIECEYLRHVQNSSFIRISDMFALMNASDNHFNIPEFVDDYEKLWKIYTGEYLKVKKFEKGVENWNRLCMCLKEYETAQEPLAKIRISADTSRSYKGLIYFLPEYSFLTVKRLLQRLVEYKIVEKESSLVNYTSDTCKLELKVDETYENQLDAVFANPQILLPYYGMEIQKYRGHDTDYVEIRCNNLTVTDVNLDQMSNGGGKAAINVLKQLEKAHFICQLKENQNDFRLVSFVYSSPRIKHLLTSAGKILEVYAYYEVLKTGYFDDVACGYEFCWDGGEKNELSLVLTKGFKSIIVECKAVVEQKLDFYHKLYNIADLFGIGTKMVLLGNTYARADIAANNLNIVQKSSSSQLSIRTISDEEEIVDIGETLKLLMKMN